MKLCVQLETFGMIEARFEETFKKTQNIILELLIGGSTW